MSLKNMGTPGRGWGGGAEGFFPFRVKQKELRTPSESLELSHVSRAKANSLR